jgi:hypothetical protein
MYGDNAEAKERYGIDLSEIDKSELDAGEVDVYEVFVADLGDPKGEPSPLIVGLMHYIQQKYVVGFDNDERRYVRV